ncbi:MAG: LEA type 2 family protein [Acidobacteriota bacterium]|nr:LEA type 2 family protein [Acidobacteriota bacterium]MDH3522412.1 LEA type 2 family protein [Acidobacteriota bacterium]
MLALRPSLSCFALALVASGCASLGTFSPPEVTLVDVRFEDLTLFESSGVLTVRIANENDDPILVDGGVYNLYLDGMKVGKALSNAQLEVPRLASATAEVEIHVNNLALATRIRQIIDRGAVDYRLTGKFFLDRSLGRRKIGFDRSGRYDFQRAAELTP